MTFYLRHNTKVIRDKIAQSGIDVCVCAAFIDSVWLDYSTKVANGVHGVGYYSAEMGTNSRQEALDMFLAEAHDLVECKDVEEFIAKIKTHAE